MKSTKLIYLTADLHSRDRHLIELLSNLLEVEVLSLDQSPRSQPRESRYVEEALKERSGSSILWISRLPLARHIPLARELGFQTILDHPGHPIPSRLSIRDLTFFLSLSRSNAEESRRCSEADAVIVRSSQEASRLARFAPRASVHVLQSTVDPKPLSALGERPGKGILLAGDYRDPAQLGGLKWFVHEVFPFLRARLKEKLPPVFAIHLSSTPLQLAFLAAAPEIHFRQGDLEFSDYLAESAYFINPAREESRAAWRTHAHDPSRILQAMAAGRPVVSTGVGTHGLVLSPTFDVWIADAPDRFAAALIHLMDNEKLRRQIAANAIQTVKARYDEGLARARLLEILKSVLR